VIEDSHDGKVLGPDDPPKAIAIIAHLAENEVDVMARSLQWGR
jgi:hypothetical protein